MACLPSIKWKTDNCAKVILLISTKRKNFEISPLTKVGGSPPSFTSHTPVTVFSQLPLTPINFTVTTDWSLHLQSIHLLRWKTNVTAPIPTHIIGYKYSMAGTVNCPVYNLYFAPGLNKVNNCSNLYLITVMCHGDSN